MADERFEEHLRHPEGRGREVAGARDGSAGGAACGDLVRISLRVSGDRVVDAGFEASGCGATIAAGSAAVTLVLGETVLDAARVGTHAISEELGGLSPGKLHAAELASDALARALGEAAARDASAAVAPGRVLVATSGGVDSSVAALLLSREGLDVACVTLELWRDPENDGDRSCCSAGAVRLARMLAHEQGLPHLTLDLRDAFRAGVVEPWMDDHAAGLTPNPCIRCNGHVRLDAMLDLATRLGAPQLATGHYARVGDDGLLRPAVDTAKDQTYMLAALSRESVGRMRFPLGDLRKPQVREIAAEAGLPVASKPDSQDLCFLAGTGRSTFLARHGGVREKPGDVVDLTGRVLGTHRGAHEFTVGQRRGLGVNSGDGTPLFVVATDARANTVTVGPREALAAHRVPVRGIRLHTREDDVARVKLRYKSTPVPCRLRGGEIELLEPFEGAAPGQTAVFLRADDAVLGTATITRR
ncbi:MAG TPA: tRNA 2-thiouridine(34) synthase MnmA [Solirubrobacteraceae bacterium]|nr:tRNA 2-thiouridine(34) synthase MnmA [Solirubrobacteraceae bacterium]